MNSAVPAKTKRRSLPRSRRVMAPNTSSGALNGANSSGICRTILDAMDQPSIDGVNAWFVAKAANEAGLKVALSGIGGDELLAGYPSFDDLPRWRRLLGPLAAIPGLGRLSRIMLRALRSRLLRKPSKGSRSA